MPMPSIVWDYFDEFEGGGKCRLCGCVRNRKDKSTSTFWQHLERVHGLDKRQLLNNPGNLLIGGNAITKPRRSTEKNSAAAAGRGGTATPSPNPNKRNGSAIVDSMFSKEQSAEKMPKLELMPELDQRATEETFKFISELVKQQQHSNQQQQQQSPSSYHHCSETIVAAAPATPPPQQQYYMKAKEEVRTPPDHSNKLPQPPSSTAATGIFPIGISLNSLEDKAASNLLLNNEAIIPAAMISPTTTNGGAAKSMKSVPTPPPVESRTPSLNEMINVMLDVANSTSLSSSKSSGNSGSSSRSSGSSNASPTPSSLSLIKAKSKSPAASTTANTAAVSSAPAAPVKKRDDYLSWAEFFMGTAILTAQRSKDPSTQVGACIVKDNIIVGVGYNGMPLGCHDDAMPWGKRDNDPLNTKYPYVCHAEMNAIMNKNCAELRGATLYTTMFPCNECAKLIIQARISHVVFLQGKESVEMNASRRLFDIVGVKYSQFEPTRAEVVIKFDGFTINNRA